MSFEASEIVFKSKQRVGECLHIIFEGARGGEGFLEVRDVFAGVRLTKIDSQGGCEEGSALLPQIWGDWSLVCCLKGSMNVAFNGAEECLEEGREALLAPQNCEVNALLPTCPAKVLALAVSERALSKDALFMMRNYFAIDLGQPSGLLSHSPSLSLFPASLEDLSVFAELCEDIATIDQARLRLKCLGLMLPHGACTFDARGGVALRSCGTASHREIAFRARQVMVSDLSRAFTIEQLAQACGTSPTVLKQAFRESLGMPVYTWFRHYRIMRSCELMEREPDRSIASIAAEVGYANPSKFAKAFADCMGTTPRAWRSQRMHAGGGLRA